MIVKQSLLLSEPGLVELRSAERVGLFSTPTQQTNACYSAGKCIYSDLGPPKPSRLHTLNFSPSLILLGPVILVMAGLILVANLVGLVLYGWRGILAVLIAVPVGVFVIGFFLTPVFINEYDDILQENFPHWRACQNEPNTPSCSMDPDCHDWHCTPKGIFSVRPRGSANWEFTRLVPIGPILLATALLLTFLAAPESVRRLRRLRRSPPPARA